MELNIHAHLAIKVLDEPAIALWYLCRGLDPEGSGKAKVTRQQLAEQFGKSRTTIWRWLNNRKFFRHYYYDVKEGCYVVYLCSIVKVCLALNVVSLGGIGQSDTVDDLAEQAALIEAQKVQGQSYYLAKTSGEGWLMVKPEEYFDPEGKPLCNISLCSKTARQLRIKDFSTLNKRPIMVLRRIVQTYGASQYGIAKRLGISVNTVRKLLAPASKIQPALHVSWKYLYRARFEAEENLGSPLETGFLIRKGIPLKLLPYRYYPLYALRSCKGLRRAVIEAWLY